MTAYKVSNRPGSCLRGEILRRRSYVYYYGGVILSDFGPYCEMFERQIILLKTVDFQVPKLFFRKKSIGKFQRTAGYGYIVLQQCGNRSNYKKSIVAWGNNILSFFATILIFMYLAYGLRLHALIIIWYLTYSKLN